MTHPIPYHAARGAAAHLRFWNLLPALRAAALGLALSLTAFAYAGPKWDPIDPADLAATDSTLTPGADAEVIFMRKKLTERTWWDAEVDIYLRAKVYTAKGVERFGTFEIPHFTIYRVSGVAGRVVKPDGRVIELKKQDIKDTSAWKTRYVKMKVTRAALPNIEPGDIVEYQWKREESGLTYVRWDYVQDTIPTREFSYHAKSLAQTFIAWPNCQNVEQKKRGSDLIVTVRDIPAFEAEEFMPPDREFRGWISGTRTFDQENYERRWKSFSEGNGTQFNSQTSPSGSLKEAAEAIIGNAVTDEDKLRRLYEFCQSEITNFTWVDKPEMQKIREKRRTGAGEMQNAKETFTRKYGWAHEINFLFGGLARAAGYDARLVLTAGVDELLNVRTPRGWAFLRRDSVAVRLGDTWHFFDPGSYFVPFGMMDWRDEGATALICDRTGKEVIYAEVPRTPAGNSREASKCKLELTSEGTLEGEVEMVWTGHLAIERKAQGWEDSQEDVDESFREEFNKVLPDAEITDLTWENLRSRAMPLVARFNVRVPGYAEAVGKRLLVRPAFFAVGEPVVFAPATRKYPIAFPYASQESEDVSIRLPEGYELEQPTAPRNIGKPGGDFEAKYTIKYGAKSRTLRHSREFTLGGAGGTMFQAESYPVLKSLFEELHQSDTHAIMIRPKAVSESAQANSDGAPSTR